MPEPQRENVVEEVKVSHEEPRDDPHAVERSGAPLSQRTNPIASALWAPPSRGLHRPMPGTEDYYAEKLPGFPPYVHEAFAAKNRGEEAYREFLDGVARPGILSEVEKEDEVTGEIVKRDVVVNWF